MVKSVTVTVFFMLELFKILPGTFVGLIEGALKDKFVGRVAEKFCFVFGYSGDVGDVGLKTKVCLGCEAKKVYLKSITSFNVNNSYCRFTSSLDYNFVLI